jgi:hypothetical protein
MSSPSRFEVHPESPWAWPFWIPAMVFLAALLFGCATPQPIYRLKPRGDVTWVGGRAALQREIGGVRVAAAFDQQDGDRLGLRVEIHNGTEEPIEVGPREIWFSACSSTAVETCTSSLKVVDPERVLAELEEKQARDTASARNSQVGLGVLVLLSAFADIATIASGKADRNTGLLTASSAGLAEIDAAARNSELASLESQRQLWANQTLRRNTLLPGQETSGEVFIPLYPDANYVWLQLRIGGKRFSFHFEQWVRHVAG